MPIIKCGVFGYQKEKKFMTKKIAIVFCITVLSMTVHAQEWVEKMNDPNINFYEVEKAYDKHFEGKSYERGQGMKQFERWRNFMSPRVYPSGNRINALSAYDEKINFEKHNKIQSQKTSNWTPIGPTSWQSYSYNPGHGRVNSVRVDPNNPNIIYLGTPAGGCWKSIDGGQNWNPITDDLPVIGVSDIAINPNNSNEMYISTGDGYGGDTYSIGVLKSSDAGATWNQTGLNFFRSQNLSCRTLIMNPLNPNVLWLATGVGLVKTSDGGATWAVVLSGDVRNVKLKPGDTSVVYASTDQFYKSIDAGDTFTQITSGISSASSINRMEIAVTPANSNYVYAIAGNQSDGSYEGLYLSTNSGNSFVKMSSSPNIFSYEQDGTGSGGQSNYDLAIAVSDLNANEVYIGGINVWKSINGGANWQIQSHWYYPPNIGYTHADIHALEWYNGKIYCGSDGGIFSSSNNGSTWTNLSNTLQIMQFYKMAQTEQDSIIVMGGAQDNGCNFRTNQGNWFHVLGADGMNVEIDPTNSNILYYESQNGNIRRSYNGGVSSQRISNTPSSAENGAWVTPFTLDPNNSLIIYAGYENVWKSSNRGSNWTVISNFSGSSTLRQLKVAPSNSNYIYTCTDDNLIKRTINGGSSWTTINSGLPNLVITDIEIHPSFEDSVWVSFSGYSVGSKVYVTGNGGSTWTNLSSNIPTLPVNDLAYDTVSHTLYAGTDIGVYYQNPHVNLNWSSFNNGLPNVIVNELEIHYGSKKLRAATYGRGMWESNLERSIAIGINETNAYNEDSYKISPNPTKDYITISWKNENPNNIRVINIKGKEVIRISKIAKRPIEIDLTDLSSGIYFIEIQDSTGIKTKKIIKE
jgi:photosystem II stability/assembly factor-like uncharacterized protein